MSDDATYNPTRYTEKQLPKEGETMPATVTDIKEGTLGDFIPEEALAKWDNANAADRAIQISALTQTGEIRKRVVQLPETEEIHPRSNLARWKANYGDYPKIGQEIVLIADKDGWFQFKV